MSMTPEEKAKRFMYDPKKLTPLARNKPFSPKPVRLNEDQKAEDSAQFILDYRRQQGHSINGYSVTIPNWKTFFEAAWSLCFNYDEQVRYAMKELLAPFVYDEELYRKHRIFQTPYDPAKTHIVIVIDAVLDVPPEEVL